MKRNRLNFVTAVVILLASGVWFSIGQNGTGVIWLVCGFAWLAASISRLRPRSDEPHPASRVVRRLSRLLLWS